MFKLASSHQTGREKFTNTRATRIKKALIWKAIRDSKALTPAETQERGPPTVLAAA